MIGGNLNVQTGPANTTFDTGREHVDGSRVPPNFNFGDGNNVLLPTGDVAVYGNLNLNAGNGANSIQLGQAAGVVHG